jgi:hypothetical protein
MPSITIPGGITAGSVSAGIYRSSEVSGEEKIVARVNGEKKGEAMIRVRVPGCNVSHYSDPKISQSTDSFKIG